jgi:2-polyprenyl-6-methoxyphenol hydroxylase-like FAD-dependent oxidoreductase
MNTQNDQDVPVLIAGAGPAGMATAITLARHGVGSLLVERRPAHSDLPRATAVSTRSMELMRSWGIEDEIRDGGVEAEWELRVCETLATARDGFAVPVGMPTRDQSALISPTAPACVPQDHVERVLLRYLRTFAGAHVAFATELTGMANGPGGVRAVVRDRESGRSRHVRARYVVAADGAHSRLRTGLGIAMRGPDRLADAVTVLFRARLWDVLGEARNGIYDVTTPDAAAVFLPAGRGDRWICAWRFDPETDPVESFTSERVKRMIRAGAGIPDLELKLERIGSFSYAAQLADSFRKDSAFLVGDAAHRISPRGGTGMNAAIQDGVDLGWKLAWALDGWAGDELLESYESERRPVVEHNLARSIDPAGSTRETSRELSVDLGHRIRHVWVPDAGARVSTLDLLGTGLTLFTAPGGEAWEAAAVAATGPLPIVVQPLDAITARALGMRTGGALLARPDGAPAALWPTHTGAGPALRGALAELTGKPRAHRELMLA